MIGLRVGELVALRWSDWTDINHLHIMRKDIRNQDTGNYTVVGHTKTNRDRFVILVPKTLKILNKISHESDYIFVRNGQRITARQIAYVLEKYAERQGGANKIHSQDAQNLRFKIKCKRCSFRCNQGTTRSQFIIYHPRLYL